MKILVTGAGGQLGGDVVAVAQEVNHEVVALTRADVDITDPRAVKQAVRAEGPQAIINCAAYTDVDGAEANERQAMAVNADGAQQLALAAAEVEAAVVYPSTDYVFDGTKQAPYVESDPANPLSLYGMSKLAGEQATASANPRHFIVRSSWLFGAGGRNFVETMLALGEELDEVLVVNDQVGCPTYTRHLAVGIVRLIDTIAFGIHHMAGGGEPCSWYELAQAIFAESGASVRVLAGTTEMLSRPAKRPAYSALGTEREDAIVLPDWREGLRAYLAKREQRAAAT